VASNYLVENSAEDKNDPLVFKSKDGSLKKFRKTKFQLIKTRYRDICMEGFCHDLLMLYKPCEKK